MNADDVDIVLCRVAHPMLQHYGIDLNSFRYSSSQLGLLRRQLPAGTRVDVKWPWHDVGYVWVWDPIDEQYFKVANVEVSYEGLTLDQAKAARGRLRDDSHQRRTRAQASEIVRDLAEKAMSDKKLAQRKRGARLENRTSKELHRSMQQEIDAQTPLQRHSEQPACADDDIQPFDSLQPAR